MESPKSVEEAGAWSIAELTLSPYIVVHGF
jgi:hypothetical protein